MTRNFKLGLLFALLGMVGVVLSVAPESAEDESKGPKVTHMASLIVEQAGDPVGRITFGLFGGTVPKTVANFVELCQSGHGYKGSRFHRVIRDFMIQGGEVYRVNGSAVGSSRFANENYKLKHYGAGWVSTANAPKDKIGSQFFITTVKTPWLDGRHVVFGKVLKGMDVVRKIEKGATTVEDKPIKVWDIRDCDLLPVIEPFPVARNRAEEP